MSWWTKSWKTKKTRQPREDQSEWAALEKLVGAEPRLRQVAKDWWHFDARIGTIDGKATIVCMSRTFVFISTTPSWRCARTGTTPTRSRVPSKCDDRLSS